MGARGETAGGRLAEALASGREERIGRGRVTANSLMDIPSMFASTEEYGRHPVSD